MSKLDILLAFEKLGEREVTTKEIMEALPPGAPERNVVANTGGMSISIGRLIKDGKLRRIGAGKGCKFQRVTTSM